jgi:hypothetical protein
MKTLRSTVSEQRRSGQEESVPIVSGPVFRVAKGAIGNLTINGMGDRAGKPLPMPVVESFPGSGAEPRKLAAEEFCSGGCRVPGM